MGTSPYAQHRQTEHALHRREEATKPLTRSTLTQLVSLIWIAHSDTLHNENLNLILIIIIIYIIHAAVREKTYVKRRNNLRTMLADTHKILAEGK